MPFVAVNCGVIPKELAPSLFFGHIKGTFTGADTNKDGYFEMAKGGTLFLDEIGTLSVEVQAMLLRVLQEGTYIPIGSNREKRADVRIVAATNEDLQLAIQENGSGKTYTTGYANSRLSCLPCTNVLKISCRWQTISGKIFRRTEKTNRGIQP